MVRSPSAFAGDARAAGLIPGSGRSLGIGNGNPLQYSCLENPRTEEPGGLQSTGLQRVDMTEHTHVIWIEMKQSSANTDL